MSLDQREALRNYTEFDTQGFGPNRAHAIDEATRGLHNVLVTLERNMAPAHTMGDQWHHIVPERQAATTMGQNVMKQQAALDAREQAIADAMESVDRAEAASAHEIAVGEEKPANPAPYTDSEIQANIDAIEAYANAQGMVDA